jgi:5-methylcytosine-specific restriction endonuclease McrA
MKAYAVQWAGIPDVTQYMAWGGTPSQLRYKSYLSIHDLWNSCELVEIRITRAPQFDHLAKKFDDKEKRWDKLILNVNQNI